MLGEPHGYWFFEGRGIELYATVISLPCSDIEGLRRPSAHFATVHGKNGRTDERACLA